MADLLTSLPFLTDNTITEAETMEAAAAGEQPGKDDASDLLEVGLAINKYASPVILAVGLVGNTLSLILMQRPFMKSSTSAVYFSTLAVADCLRLLMGFTGVWMTNHTGEDPWSLNDIACKIQRILSAVTFSWPAWIILALTGERLMAVSLPFKAKKWLTVTMARAVCVAITLLSLLLWSVVYLSYGVSIGPCNERLLTDITREYVFFLVSTLYTFIPAPLLILPAPLLILPAPLLILPDPLLILLNSVLVWQPIAAQKQQGKMTGNTSQTNSKTSRITVVAVTVSVIYLVLTLPSGVVSSLYAIALENGKLIEVLRADRVKFCREVFNVVRDLNHAINFFLYLWILPKVRQELLNMWHAATAAVCVYAKPEGTVTADDSSRPTTSTLHGDEGRDKLKVDIT